MRTLFYCIIFCFISSNIFAQVSTTAEEYNYLTKGYKIQVESGLDMKRGYELRMYATSTISSYKFEFRRLIRTSSNETAAMLIVAKSNVSGITYYFCIPINNNELLENYYAAILSLDKSMNCALSVATARALSGVLN